MKKIIILFSVVFLLFSCSESITELNQNKKDFATVTDASLLVSAKFQLFNQMTSTSVNFNVFRLFAQYWTETTYTDETNYNLLTRNIPENHWEELYRDVLKDLDEAKGIVANSTNDLESVKTNKTAIIEVLEVYTYYVLLATFGDIPYTEALDIDNLSPVYDDQSEVFNQLVTRLNDKVIAKLDTANSTSFTASEDIVYGGDIKQWLKFANSLKFQMGMLIADVDMAKAKTMVSEAFTAGIFDSSDDNMKITYESAQPNTNPLYTALTVSGRSDFIPSEGFVDKLNDLKDPRRPFYFTLLKGKDVYKGGVYGTTNNFADFSHISDNIANEPTLEAPLLTYFEMQFLLAEAVERTFITTGTAKKYYDEAVKSSILYWGGTEKDATTYLANPKVAYDNSMSGANYKEKIGQQKWIALYNRGFEAWTEWRRLDFPKLVAPKGAETDNKLPPLRYTYPTNEQTLNNANWKAASSAIGGDELETKLFWDK